MCVIVCCEVDTFARIYTRKSASCMRLCWGNGSPAKVFAATPLLIMIMRIVLSFGRVNKQRPTNERAPGTHQAQADVDWMAMTSCEGSLNYLCHHTAEKRKKCVCLCVWDNLTVGWLFAGLSSSRFVKFDPENAGVDLHNFWLQRCDESHRVRRSSRLCLLIKSPSTMYLLRFSFVSIKLDLNLWRNVV